MNAVAPTPAAPPPDPAKIVNDIVLKLADEGIPLRAIARTVGQQVPPIRDAVSRAIDSGRLVFTPRDDWPPGTSREERLPDIPMVDTGGDALLFALAHVFKITKLHARVFAVLLHRPLVTKKMAHNAIEDGRGARSEDERTQEKIVDVVICHLRKRIKKFGLSIETSWANGYYMDPAQQKEGQKLLLRFRNPSQKE